MLAGAKRREWSSDVVSPLLAMQQRHHHFRTAFISIDGIDLVHDATEVSG